MTVTSSVQRADYSTDGITSRFAIPFYFLNETHISVSVTTAAGVVHDLVLGSDYSVSGAGNDGGGEVQTFGVWGTGGHLAIYRAVPATQESRYLQNDPFPSKTTETALDKLTMLVQQTTANVQRALTLGLRDMDGSGAYRANNNRISNLGAPVADTDAATLGAARDIAEQLTAGVVGGYGSFFQSGPNAVERTFQNKMRDVFHVRDFGAKLTGSASDDDAAAFVSAIAAAPSGSTIKVSGGNVYLSENPAAGNTKSLKWDIAYGTKFYGPGASSGSGFARLFTNNYSLTAGPWLASYGAPHPPVGGTSNLYSIEHQGESGSDFPKTFKATVTNGSAVLTNVTSTAGLFPGCRLTANVPGWPVNTNPPFHGAARVWAINGNTIEFRVDTATGPESQPFTGSTADNVTFTADWFGQTCPFYIGVDSGGNYSRDNTIVAQNIVVNVRPGTGTSGQGAYGGLEIDVNNSGNSSAQFGLLLTGGNVDNSGGAGAGYESTVAMRVERGFNNWITGINVKDSYFGVTIEAQNTPLMLKTNYNAPAGSGSPSGKIGRGIYFDNAPDRYGMLFLGRQLANGNDIIRVDRFTDVNPTGAMLRYRNAADTADVFLVDANGCLRSYAPSNANGGTDLAGSAEFNGLTIRGNCHLRFGQTFTPGAPTPNGFIDALEGTGALVHIPVYKP